MFVRRKRGWEIAESSATPEALFEGRRRFVKSLSAGPILLAAPGLLVGCEDVSSAIETEADPSAPLYPVTRNERYKLDRPVTTADLVTTYNNYYEFGSSKNIARKAQALPLRPWRVTIDGMVEKPFEIAIDELLKRMPLEERLYRHRCVEAWSMAVPWSGFAFKALLDLARPLGSAKYVVMTSFENAEAAGGQRSSWYPWPYVEGLTMAEAANELAFLVTGAYGKPALKQNGAPLRLAVPWKYGFKSAKGIVLFRFTEKRPVSFWEEVQGREYGFWANVNPKVPHPRWSQATERVLGTPGRVPTRLYNGYGEFVAGLYAGMTGERLFM